MHRQGPCRGNQLHFATNNTDLLETLNRMMRSKPRQDQEEDQEVEIKLTVLGIFQGLVEGEVGHGESAVYDRIFSIIHLDVLQQMVVGPLERKKADRQRRQLELAAQGEVDDGNEEEEDKLTDLQVESLVLIEMLCDYRPSLQQDLAKSLEALGKFVGDVTAVELVWNGVLQRRFFHVPDICSNLSKASREKLVEEGGCSRRRSQTLGLAVALGCALWR